MIKLKKLLQQACIELKRHNIATPELDARIILQHVANLSFENICLQQELEISDDIVLTFSQLIARRIDHEPVAKIIGSKAFWLSDFVTSIHTLDPRPDSEVIIEAALELFPAKDSKLKLLDLGTGTGCLLLSLLQEFPQAIGIASDISPQALKVAKQNIQLLNLCERAMLVEQNWSDALTGKFDLIVSNPPYISTAEISALDQEVQFYDPQTALDGGEDGLECYRYLAKQILLLLKPNAYAILEFGFGQGDSVRRIFIEERYQICKMLFDLSGAERAIIVRV